MNYHIRNLLDSIVWKKEISNGKYLSNSILYFCIFRRYSDLSLPMNSNIQNLQVLHILKESNVKPLICNSQHSFCYKVYAFLVVAMKRWTNKLCFFHIRKSSLVTLILSKSFPIFIVPTDKESNNYAFVCKRYYIDILLDRGIWTSVEFSNSYTSLSHVLSKQKCCLLSTGVSTESQNLTSELHLRQDFVATRNDSYRCWSCAQLCEAFTFLMENVYV